jgi:hypothetical protein
MTRIVNAVLFALLLTAFLGTRLEAQTINAASCNASDVQRALNLVTASTTTVNIPAGTCNWTSEISFTLPSGSTTLSILGAGSLSTAGGGDVTVIVDNVSGTDAVLSVTAPGAASLLRIGGLTFDGGSGVNKDHGFLELLGGSQNVRVDHSHFNASTYSSGTATSALTVTGVYGVVDHNIFDLVLNSEINGVVISYPGAGTFGDETWAAATGLGSSSFLFVENNTFNGGATNDCQHGGRFVIRYNTLSTSAIQTHPTGGAGRGRGCRAWEFYNNTLSASNSSPQYNAFFLSSGTGVIWGNTANTGYEQFLTIQAMRKSSSTYAESPTPSGWGYCGTSSGLAGDGSTWDQTQGSSGYACLDQPGRGKGDLLSGQFPIACDMTTGCTTYNGTWPNQALEPLYEWLDSWAAAPGYPYGFATAATPTVEVQNQDYYLWCNASANGTGCTSFNGSTGVGSGLFSARPSTCTPQVAYWATDTTTLYQCSAANAWSVYYTPFTYPHPLTQGTGTAPAAPTDLQVTVE